MSNPTTVRLPQKITDMINTIVSIGKKKPSDFIREAVEEKAFSVANSYNARVTPLLVEKAKTINTIRDILLVPEEAPDELRRLNLEERTAMIYFIHEAYCQTMGYVNASYINILLDITFEMLEEAKKKNIRLDFDFYRSTLHMNMMDKAEFDDIKARFPKNPSGGWADLLTRPLVDIASELDEFDVQSVFRIINHDRLKKLLPVAIKGSGTGLSSSIISRDMKQLIPDSLNIKVGDLTLSICADPFCMVWNGKHHSYAFKTESLMSLILFSKQEIPSSHEHGFSLRQETFEAVILEEKVMLHEHGGYRLHLSKDEFNHLRQEIKKMSETRQWKWMIERFNNHKGNV